VLTRSLAVWYEHEQAAIRRSALQCVSLLASPSSEPTYLIAGSDAIIAGPSTLPSQTSTPPSPAGPSSAGSSSSSFAAPSSSSSLSSAAPTAPQASLKCLEAVAKFDLSDALRTTGLLPYVLSIAMKWPAVDVPTHVAVAAVWVLAHATAGNPDNQTALGAAGACELMVRIITTCVLDGTVAVDCDATSVHSASDSKLDDGSSSSSSSSSRASSGSLHRCVAGLG
jgi:hypothetical protein